MPAEAIAIAIKEVASLLKKWGGALAAFWVGRKSKQRQVERSDRKALENELEAEREEDRILSDPDKRERMRKRFQRTE